MRYELVLHMEIADDKLVSVGLAPQSLPVSTTIMALRAVLLELEMAYLVSKLPGPRRVGSLHLPGGPPGLS